MGARVTLGMEALLLACVILRTLLGAMAQGAESRGPVPIYAYSPDGWLIELCFDKAIERTSATNVANYALSDPRYETTSAILREDGQSVILRLARQYPFGVAKLEGTNIVGLDGQSTPWVYTLHFGDYGATDVGNPGTDPKEPGSYFNCRGDEFQIVSSGAGWEAASDGFFFVHTPVGPAVQGIYVWQISSLEAANKDSSVGVMLREDLSAISRFVCVSITATDEAARDGSGPGSALVKVLWRDQPGALPTETSGTRSIQGLVLTNLWFSIFRYDRTIEVGWRTRPGDSAETLANVTFSMPVTEKWQIGLAAASHNNAPGFSGRSVSSFYELHGDPFTLPRLRAKLGEGELTLSWTVDSIEDEYLLMSKPTHGPDTYWDVVTNPVVTTAGPTGVTNLVRVPVEPAAKFFALGVGRGF